MTTRYERLRQAADDIAACGTCDCDYCEQARTRAAALRADAAELEAVEKEMLDVRVSGVAARNNWTDRIRGEK